MSMTSWWSELMLKLMSH